MKDYFERADPKWKLFEGRSSRDIDLTSVHPLDVVTSSLSSLLREFELTRFSETYQARLTKVLVALNQQKQEVLSGKRKTELCNWYLVRIENAVHEFLTTR